MSLMIIKTKKMSAKEVKHKFHEFVDELADDCGPELEEEYRLAEKEIKFGFTIKPLSE